MKKLISLILCLAMLLSTAALAEITATASGFGGDVTVTVETDADGVITAIRAAAPNDTPQVGGAAAEKLNDGALAALVGTKLAELDPAAIDVISGATITSNAVKTALELAKAQAGGEAAAPVQDGTYTVTLPAYSVTEQMTLNITFADGKLANIETVTAGNTPVIFATVEENLYPRLIENQSLETDAISGATVAYNAVKQAVEIGRAHV